MKSIAVSIVAVLLSATAMTSACATNVVSVETHAPGLTAEASEALLTKPLESAFNNVAGVSEIRSMSGHGRSYIEVYSESIKAIDLLAHIQAAIRRARSSLPISAGEPCASVPSTALLR